ncbi:hypothetical protein JW826_05060 [Candidatus Woesearchaeota archaeon]|nr:hypothetical protein [Candidatus Woesearchaeota archaeon]
MGLFDKKPSRDDVIAQGIAQQAADAEAAAGGSDKKDDMFSSGNPKVDMEIVKIKAQLESFNEIRKSNSERFSRLGEQMGELRGMILDTNKTLSKVEVSATKAIDLVESVQPEKLMIEIRKMDGKVESLKANIESNESMMRDLMDELKKMRSQMNFYKGIEQVAKLNEEVKGEILEIKKVEATIERHADKGESIFLDMEKKFAEYEKFQKKVDDMDSVFHAIQNDFDKMKLGISNKSDRKEFITLINKFSEFEKHTSEVLKLLDERNRKNRNDMKEAVSKIKKIVAKKQGLRIDDVDISKGDRDLPDLKLKPELLITKEDAQKIEGAQEKEAAAMDAQTKEAQEALEKKKADEQRKSEEQQKAGSDGKEEEKKGEKKDENNSSAPPENPELTPPPPPPSKPAPEKAPEKELTQPTEPVQPAKEAVPDQAEPSASPEEPGKKGGSLKGFINLVKKKVDDSIQRSENGDPNLLGVIGLRKKAEKKEEHE